MTAPQTPFLSKREHKLDILGSGAVGLFLACKLRLAYPSFPLHALRRGLDGPNHQLSSNASKQTIIVSFQHTSGGQHRMQTIHIPSQRISTEDEGNFIRNLVVTTKAFSAVEAIASVRSRFLEDESGDRTNILLLCNGALAVRDELLDAAARSSSTWPATNVHLGYTTHGVIREKSIIEDDDFDHEHIVQAGIGHVQLPSSWGKEQNIDWTELWNTAGLECRPAVSAEQMEKLLWLKLGANCVINPLTALYQCTNGEIMSVVAGFSELQSAILEEVVLVALTKQRLQQPQPQQPNDPQWLASTDPTKNTSPGPDLSLELMLDFCSQVIFDTKNNKSSMLQDILNSKKTEINHLTGYVVRKGQELGISTPENAALLERVQQRSAQS
ncbi:hypothetical protein ACA910_013510 [Epithemia clementina (nom. ined.)]